MLGEGQKIDKDYKMTLAITLFLEHPEASMIELEKLSNGVVSKSSCQRYLNDYEGIIELLGKEKGEIVYEEIRKHLKSNRLESQIRGGVNSMTINKPIKDATGQFVGVVRR